MRHADWTPSPLQERANALARRGEKRGLLYVLIIGIAGVGTVASGIHFFKTFVLGGRPITLVLDLFGVLALAGAAYGLSRREVARIEESEKPDRMRRDEFGSREGWLVDLIVLQGAAPTGTDRGILWIEGDRLCFSGDRTSFALGAHDVVDGVRSELPVRGLRRSLRLTLASETAAGNLALSYDLVDGSSIEASWQIGQWLRHSPKSYGQLPPAELGPGAVSLIEVFDRFVILIAAVVGTLALGFFVVSYLHVFEFGALSLGILVLVLFLLLGRFRLLYRVAHDLRRVGR